MTSSETLRINTVAQWDEFVSGAGDRPIWLLKHSLACPLSRDGLNEFERFVAQRKVDPADDSLYVVIEVQNARELSHEIAFRTGVRHESPQALLILGGDVRWHGSHWSITTSALSQAAQAAEATAGVESE